MIKEFVFVRAASLAAWIALHFALPAGGMAADRFWWEEIPLESRPRDAETMRAFVVTPERIASGVAFRLLPEPGRLRFEVWPQPYGWVHVIGGGAGRMEGGRVNDYFSAWIPDAALDRLEFDDDGDSWVGCRAVLSDGVIGISARISRLLPTLILETASPRIGLFETPGAMVAFPTDNGVSAHRLGGWPATPSFSLDAGTPESDIGFETMSEPWCVVYYGDMLQFEGAPSLPCGPHTRPHQRRQGWLMKQYEALYQAAGVGPEFTGRKTDRPYLLVFSEIPESAEVGSPHGLHFDFFDFDPGSLRRIAVVPLFTPWGPASDETAAWHRNFPQDVADCARWWVERLADIPVDVAESYAIDEETDTLTITQSFEFSKFAKRDSATRFAPLPPMMAVALNHGFPAKVSDPVVDSGAWTYCGPCAGVELAPGISSYTISAQGFGKYFRERRAPGQGKENAALTRELENEVRKALDAGHMAPWPEVPTIKYIQHEEKFTWSSPADSIICLLSLRPLVGAELQERIDGYVREERKLYPPEDMQQIPFNVGARREAYRYHEDYYGPGSAFEEIFYDRDGPDVPAMSHTFYTFNKCIPLHHLYALAEYYRSIGDTRELDEVWRAKIRDRSLEPYMAKHDWATMSFFYMFDKFPRRMDSKTEPPPVEDGRMGVFDTNRILAGLVGYVRMAEMTGDTDAAGLGYFLFVKTAMLRKAQAAFVRDQYDRGFWLIPHELLGPDWALELSRDNSEQAEGFPWTADWTQTGDDVRQVLRMNETDIELGNRPSHVYAPFFELVPETGRLLRDLAPAECRRYVERVAEAKPDWCLAFAEANPGGGEVELEPACNPYTIFLARAWVLENDAATLESYIDVPHVERGDWYHMHKLAETIKAHEGWIWE